MSELLPVTNAGTPLPAARNLDPWEAPRRQHYEPPTDQAQHTQLEFQS